MEGFRIPLQAIQWELSEYKRKPRLLRKNWVDKVRRHMKDPLPRVKPKNWRQTEQNGVNVWVWPMQPSVWC